MPTTPRPNEEVSCRLTTETDDPSRRAPVSIALQENKLGLNRDIGQWGYHMTGESPAACTPERGDGVDRIEQAWARERPDIDASSVGIVSRIWRLARHLERERNRSLAEHGTDHATVEVLAVLRRAGKPYRMTAGQLTKAALISAAGISNRLDKLERSGLLKRSFHTNDRRRVNVQLTKKGVEFVDKVASDLMDHNSQLIALVDSADHANLRKLLKILLAQFENPNCDQG